MKRADTFLFIYIRHWLRLAYWVFPKTWKLRNIVARRATRTIPMWSRLAIELQSNCNRDCYFCPRSGDRSGIRKDSNGKHVKKSMPTWKIFDIINQAVELGFKRSLGFPPYKGSIGFHRLSEPFLDKRYVEVAAYAKEKGLKIMEDTNGDILKKNPVLCSKIDGLVDVIVIGIYDYKNNKEKKEQVRFWKNRFKKTKVVFSLAAEFPLQRQNAKNYDKKLVKLVTPKIANYPCFGTNGLRIRYDGEVSLCCEDDQCTFKLGNVFDSSIRDIWWSEKHIKIVNSLKVPGGRKLYPLCRNCGVV
ncbi:MAG: SPASM domain-containing protein [Thermoplasmatales archaeon]|nr:MAG: SPASM domain-containing protein [Thermoplasmatales archaeon]